jgi:hypothetical protein
MALYLFSCHRFYIGFCVLDDAVIDAVWLCCGRGPKPGPYRRRSIHCGKNRFDARCLLHQYAIVILERLA